MFYSHSSESCAFTRNKFFHMALNTFSAFRKVAGGSQQSLHILVNGQNRLVLIM